MKTSHFALLAGIGLLTAAPVSADDLFSKASWTLLTPTGGALLQTTPDQVLHVTVRAPLKEYYQIELTHDAAVALPANSTIVYHFFARSPTGSPIHAVVEKRTAPYTKVMDNPIVLTPTWKEYTFTAKVPVAYGEKGLAARLQVGEKAGAMDFKGITLTRTGR